MIEVRRIDFVAVPVEDLAAADSWYGETLGLPRNPSTSGMWTLAFACLLALPLLTFALPALHLPAPAWLGAAMPLRQSLETADTAAIIYPPSGELPNDPLGPDAGMARTNEIQSATGQAKDLWARCHCTLL